MSQFKLITNVGIRKTILFVDSNRNCAQLASTINGIVYYCGKIYMIDVDFASPFE